MSTVACPWRDGPPLQRRDVVMWGLVKKRRRNLIIPVLYLASGLTGVEEKQSHAVLSVTPVSNQNYFSLSSQIPFNGSHFRRPQLANSRSSLNHSADDLVPFSYILFIIKLMPVHLFWHKSICSLGTFQSYLPTCDATRRNIAFFWWICSDLLPQSVKNDF